MYKDYLNIQINLIIITVVTILLIISSINLSFSKDYDIDIKGISMADNNNKIEHNDIKEKTTQNDLLNDLYPSKFFLCGYPQELITDYNSFEKIKCN